MKDALGIIETHGLATAIEAADAAVKAANVKLGDYVSIGGAKINVIINGDVAAVKAAVEAGVNAACQIGQVHTSTVIPRPSAKLVPTFPIKA